VDTAASGLNIILNPPKYYICHFMGYNFAQILKQPIKIRVTKILLFCVPSDSVPMCVNEGTKYSRKQTPLPLNPSNT